MALILNGSDTSAGDDAGLGYTSAEGIIITGQGSTSDVTIKNDADATVISIPTGSNHVGIGTTSPATELEIYNAGFSAAQITSNSSSETQLRFATNTAGRISNQANTALIFDTNATERVRIANDGKVGISTSSAENPLTIQDIGGSTFNRDFAIRNGDATNYHRLILGYNAASAASGVPTNAQFILAEKGGGYGTSAGLVVGNSDGAPVMFTTSATERMRINASGNVLVNKTNTTEHTDGIMLRGNATTVIARDNDALAIWADNATANTGGTKGHILFKRGTNAVLVGSVTSTTSATSFNTSSDYRLKENVDYSWDATARLKQLKPARFNFISDPDVTIDGFIAHEAQEVVPHAVTGKKDAKEMQAIDQSKLVPLLVKAMQEQQTVIEALEARISTLEGS